MKKCRCGRSHDSKFKTCPRCLAVDKTWKDQNKAIRAEKSHLYYEDLKINKPWIRLALRCRDRCFAKAKAYYAKRITFHLTAEQAKTLWDRDKAHLLKKPSLDRIDPKGNYTFENCQIIEHTLNSGKKGLNQEYLVVSKLLEVLHKIEMQTAIKKISSIKIIGTLATEALNHYMVNRKQTVLTHHEKRKL